MLSLRNIGEDLPPFPARLIKRIQSWKFIEVFELLLVQLSSAAVNEDHPKSSKPPNKPTLLIIECF